MKFKIIDMEGHLVDNFDKIKISFENGILSLTSDTYKLLSYTGVSDVKGIDIYEGDIIEYGYLLDGKIYSYETVVEKDINICCGFVIRNASGVKVPFYGISDGYSILKVVGNVFIK